MSDLSSLKAGDLAIRSSDGHIKHCVKIAKVGKIHIVTEHGEKFRLSGISVDGGTWSKRYLSPYHEKEWRAYLEKHRHKNNVRRLGDTHWNNFPVDLVQKICDMLDADQAAFIEHQTPSTGSLMPEGD